VQALAAVPPFGHERKSANASEGPIRMNAPHYAAIPYRSDIDGLRAIAVLSVVLYHFGLPLRGGFVGVDIFFVISGYLIGGILWREYDATGRIWLRNFYARRFRRLAPAFVVVALVTTLLAYALMLPFEFREFGKSLIAATFYLSNVLFYRQAGYFNSASEDKPLLHTWSLAVEEQFYIFLPLFILLLAHWRRRLLGALVAAWALSLAGCVLLTPRMPEAAFYLFPFRAWELLSGVLLAIWSYETGREARGFAMLSWLGLAMVGASIVFIPAGPLFPGMLAIVPVLGTVLLLANGTGDNSVNRILCHPHMVFFGLISYSLYLWHWPVLVLSSYLRDGHANLLESGLWMMLSVGLAYLTWRFVENPVRYARRLSGGVVMFGTACASALLLWIGGWVFAQDGLPDRFDGNARVHITASGDFVQDRSRCYTADSLPLDGLDVCPIGPDGPPRVLIWGDSHLRAFHEGLALAAEEAGTPAIILWRSGCPPLFDVRKLESAATRAQDTECTQANRQIKQALGQIGSIDSVLLIGRWAYYAEGRGVGLDQHNTIALFPTDSAPREDQLQAQLLMALARDTTMHLRGFVDRVHVLRQPPEIPFYDSRKAAREAAHAGWPLAAPRQSQPAVSRDLLTLRTTLADAPWVPLANSELVTWIDPWPRFCEGALCHAIHGGVGQYFDNNHITNSAALRVRDLFAPVFDPRHPQTALVRQEDP
jgi:peptidoglycan/LPS O-acetylase OafA/YrhL